MGKKIKFLLKINGKSPKGDKGKKQASEETLEILYYHN